MPAATKPVVLQDENRIENSHGTVENLRLLPLGTRAPRAGHREHGEGLLRACLQSF